MQPLDDANTPGGLHCRADGGYGMPFEEGLPKSTAVLDRSFFSRPVATVAAELQGIWLMFDGVGGIIVETEAYEGEDPA
jgi:hypothetical protein